jgi:hypothetical protein
MKLALVASFCGFAIYLACAEHPHPLVGGAGTDHLSHAASTVLVARHGLAIYTQPTGAICDELCELTNWRAWPRHYPPGIFLYSIPEALLIGHVSADTVARVALIKHVAAAHLLIGVLLAFVLAGPRPRWLLAAVPLVAFAAIDWAMAGFYDALPVGLALLGVRAFADGRDEDCLLWLALGWFLCFRVIWCAPIAVVALARAQRRGWRTFVALALAAIAAAAFVYLLPSMHRLPADRWSLLPIALSSLAALALLAHARAWLLAATLAWQLAVVTHAPQLQTWHALMLVPLLALADRTAPRAQTLAALALSLVTQLRVLFFNWL